MKKLKSLTLSFALALGGAALGAQTAEAQTVPIQPQGQVLVQPAVTSSYVSQQAIDDVAYNIGVQTAYYRAGRGFTHGFAETGEEIGLEYVLSGGNATVTGAYNLKDPVSRQRFQMEVNNAYATEQRLATDEARYAQPRYTYYAPPAYVICPPVRPVIGFGLIIGGWHPHYVPSYRRWDGYWDHDGHRRPPVHIHNHTTIITPPVIIHRDTHSRWQQHDDHSGRIQSWHPEPRHDAHPPQRHEQPRRQPEQRHQGGHQHHR
jgi:hypothetical protein